MSRRLLPLLFFFTTLSAVGDDAALFTLYKNRVAPIIQGSCIGCHVSGAGPVQPDLFMLLARQPRFRRQTSTGCGRTLKVISKLVRSTRL